MYVRRTPAFETIEILGQNHHDVAIRGKRSIVESGELIERLEIAGQKCVGLLKLLVDEFQFEVVDGVIGFPLDRTLISA